MNHFLAVGTDRFIRYRAIESAYLVLNGTWWELWVSLAKQGNLKIGDYGTDETSARAALQELADALEADGS